MSITSLDDLQDSAKVKKHLTLRLKTTKDTPCYFCPTSKTLNGKSFIVLGKNGKKIDATFLKLLRKEGKGYLGSFKTVGSENVFSFPTGNAAVIKKGIISFGKENAVTISNTNVVVNVGKSKEKSANMTIAKLKGKFKKKAAAAKQRVQEMQGTEPWTEQDTKDFYSSYKKSSHCSKFATEFIASLSPSTANGEKVFGKFLKKSLKSFFSKKSDLTSYAHMSKSHKQRLLGQMNVHIRDALRQDVAERTQQTLMNHPDFSEFKKEMQQKYRENFIKEVGKALIKQEGFSKTDIKPILSQAFNDIVASLFHNEVSGLGGTVSLKSEEYRQLVTERFFQEMRKYITSLGPVSAGDGATLLWSGVGMDVVRDPDLIAAAMQKDGQISAEDQVAVAADGKALSGTPIGQLLDTLDIALQSDMMGWSRNINVWTSVSKEFANNAKGDVQVFLSEGVGAWSVFWNVELPALRQNPDVTGVYCHYLNPTTLKQVKALRKDKAAIDLLIRNPDVWIHRSLDATPILTPDASPEQQEQFDARQQDQYEEYNSEDSESDS